MTAMRFTATDVTDESRADCGSTVTLAEPHGQEASAFWSIVEQNCAAGIRVATALRRALAGDARGAPWISRSTLHAALALLETARQADEDLRRHVERLGRADGHWDELPPLDPADLPGAPLVPWWEEDVAKRWLVARGGRRDAGAPPLERVHAEWPDRPEIPDAPASTDPNHEEAA